MFTSRTFTHVAPVVLVFSALALCRPTGDVSAAPVGEKGGKIPVIAVTIAADNSFTLPATVTGGLVTFKESTADTNNTHVLQGLRVLPGHSVEEVIQDLQQMLLSDTFADRAVGHQRLLEDGELIGGVYTTPQAAIAITIPLEPGLYYFFDLNDLFLGSSPTVHTLVVVGQKRQQSLPPLDATIAATVEDGQPSFSGVPATLPPDATFSFANDTEEIHEAVLRQARPETTDQYITDFYNAVLSGGPRPPSPWLDVQHGLSMLSPGRWAVVHIELNPGTFALIDYVPSAVDGVPHAYHGMHVVVTLSD